MEDDFERVLVQLPQVYCFKIPARKSAEGHRAADWPKEHFWAGKVKITSKGKIAYIYLIDDKNQVFATCPVTDEGSVEKCLDSGRYFVLRIKNPQGKQAYIGIAFNERNDSFDFNVALSEHKAEVEREERAASGVVDTASAIPSRDLTFKEGQKITVNLGGAKKEKKPASTGKLAPPPGGKSGLLAPPPADVVSGSAHVFTSATATAQAAAPVSSSSGWGDFGDTFGSLSLSSPSGGATSAAAPRPQQQVQHQQPTSTQSSGFSSSFDSFDSSFGGASDPFAVPSTDPFSGLSSAQPNPPKPAPRPAASSNSHSSNNNNSVNLLDF